MRVTTIPYSFRIDEEVKSEFEAVLSEIGITPAMAFNVFAKRVVLEGGFPFDLVAPSFRANAAMQAEGGFDPSRERIVESSWLARQLREREAEQALLGEGEESAASLELLDMLVEARLRERSISALREAGDALEGSAERAGFASEAEMRDYMKGLRRTMARPS